MNKFSLEKSGKFQQHIETIGLKLVRNFSFSICLSVCLSLLVCLSACLSVRVRVRVGRNTNRRPLHSSEGRRAHQRRRVESRGAEGSKAAKIMN